jgi:polysaccharide biosynthesis transport protein
MPMIADGSASLSILDVVRGIWRRKLLILACLMLGVVGGLATVSINDPKYASEARVIIANLATPYDNTNGAPEPARDAYDDRFVASQVAVLQSEDLARRVVKSLDLAGKGEFAAGKKPGTIKKVALALGFGTDSSKVDKEDLAIEQLIKQTTVYPVPESDVIAVRFSSTDPKVAATVANALVDTFVLSTRETQSGPNGRARDWLAGQITLLRDKVSKSEAAAEKYRADAGLLVGQTTTLGQQQISELNSQITLAEAAASEAAAKAEDIKSMLESTGSVDASSEVLGSPVIQRLREQQVAASQKISQLSATYLPNHPKMVAAQRELSDVSTQIRREALKVVASLQGQAKVARARASSLKDSLETSKGREGQALQSDVKLKELEREAAANRTLLETMLARYADANAKQDLNMQPGYARIIQTATAAYAPYFPKVGPIMILSIIGGLALGLGLAFLMEIMSQSARIAAQHAPQVQGARAYHHAALSAAGQALPPDLDIQIPVLDFGQSASAVPVPEAVPKVLASLPAAPPLAAAFAELDNPESAPEFAAVTAELAEHVLTVTRAIGNKAVCVTSIGGSFDAAYTSVALARSLAKSRIKTILVDIVAGRPSGADLMAIADGQGLSELISGSAAVDKVILRDGGSAMQLMRFGQVAEASVRPLLTQRIGAVIASLSQVYDIVILNAGEAGPATADMLQGVGAMLFLAPQGRQRDAVAAAKTVMAKGVRQALFVRLVPRAGETEDLRRAG